MFPRLQQAPLARLHLLVQLLPRTACTGRFHMPFTSLQLWWTHFWQPSHWIKLSSAPFPQILHGHAPDCGITSRPAPPTMTFDFSHESHSLFHSLRIVGCIDLSPVVIIGRMIWHFPAPSLIFSVCTVINNGGSALPSLGFPSVITLAGKTLGHWIYRWRLHHFPSIDLLFSMTILWKLGFSWCVTTVFAMLYCSVLSQFIFGV